MLNVCFARILHTCLPLHLVPMESNKEPSSKRSITPLGTSENWLHVISQGFLCLLLHILWSSFTIFDHHVFLVHLLISASQHPGWEGRTTIVPQQAYQSKHVCPNVYAQTFYGSSSNQTTVPFLTMSNGGTFFQWWNNLPGWRCICPKLLTCTLLLFNVGRGMM